MATVLCRSNKWYDNLVLISTALFALVRHNTSDVRDSMLDVVEDVNILLDGVLATGMVTADADELWELNLMVLRLLEPEFVETFTPREFDIAALCIKALAAIAPIGPKRSTNDARGERPRPRAQSSTNADERRAA